MNYNSVILVGVIALTAAWWVLHARRHYPGPKVMTMYITEGQQLVHQAPLAADGLHMESKDKTSKEI